MSNAPTGTPQSAPPPKMPKWLLNGQIFLLRRGWMGPMNKQLMVITTTGRKSGKSFTVPIGFAPDAATGGYIGFNLGGGSNWYKNVLSNGRATLEVMGKTLDVRAEPMNTPELVRQAVDVYKRERPMIMQRFFGVDASTPLDTPEELAKLNERVKFVRFIPV